MCLLARLPAHRHDPQATSPSFRSTAAVAARRAGVKRLSVALLLAIVNLGLAAETRDSAGDTELQTLLTLLDDQTELATKTGMNADFIPGMATILMGDDLLARGARTVGDSLSLVPGINLGLEMTGERQILSRGVGYGYASGNVKIMLDGMSMNSSLLATANPILNIPIEQVERIEVIRGPGSSVHGEYAYAGVVNIVTRTRERTIHLQAVEAGSRGVGAVWNWHDPGRDLSLALNVTGLEGDGAGVPVAEDALYTTGEPELSNAPGHSNEASRYKGYFANLQWRNTLLDVKLIQDDYGDYFGINHFLPPSNRNLASKQRYTSIKIQQGVDFSDSLNAELRFEALQHDRDRDRLYVFPASYLAEEAIYMNQDYRETRYLGSVDVHWNPDPRHALLLMLEASQTQVDEASWEWLNLPFEIPSTWLDTERERRILAAVVQDEFHLSERITLTGTLRFDDYSDLGAMVSPRAAAVWRIDDENILKFQYARAFRPPTFYELEYAATGSIDASEITTYEFGYVLRKPMWQARFILFHSDLDQPIGFDEISGEGYINNADACLRGIEIEYEHRLGARFKLDANLSYVDASFSASGDPLPGGTDVLGNLGLLWRPLDSLTAALQWRYVGERYRASTDSRKDLESYGQLDLTLSYRRPGSGPYVSAGIKNLTDTDVRYPDQLTSYGGVDLPYLDDYPRAGRRWWLSIGYAF